MSKKKAKKIKEKNRIDDPQEIINSSPQPPKTDESIIIKWLKRFFSIQTLTVMATLAAAYFGYKTYSDNLPAQISLIYNLSEDGDTINHKDIDISNITEFIILSDSERGYLSLGPDDNDDELSIFSPIPIIKNNTDKSIKNFSLEVNVFLNHYVFDSSDILHPYILLKSDTMLNESNPNSGLFKYGNDILYAHSQIRSPISIISVNHSNLEENWLRCYMEYQILYEGLKSPINYTVELNTFVDKNNICGHLTESQIDQFLSSCFIDGSIKQDSHKMVLIFNYGYGFYIEPVDDSISEKSFEDYKSKIISKVMRCESLYFNRTCY